MSLIACEVCTTVLEAAAGDTVVWDDLSPLCVDCADEIPPWGRRPARLQRRMALNYFQP
jgi:hypothetical protein